MAIFFGEKNWPVQDQLQMKIVLDCWGELTRTPRADGRHQESDQELIFVRATVTLFLMTLSARALVHSLKSYW